MSEGDRPPVPQPEPEATMTMKEVAALVAEIYLEESRWHELQQKKLNRAYAHITTIEQANDTWADALNKECERSFELEEALKRYGKHEPPCDYGKPCSCGLQKVIENEQPRP